jgi:hypothetical protein
MAVRDAIAALQVKVLALTGMHGAPTDPPESINQFPFSVCYDKQGEMEMESAGWAVDLATIVCEIHCSRQNLPTAIAQAQGFREPFLKLFITDPKITNTVQEVRAVRYTFGYLDWGGQKEAHIGYQFEVDVKLTLTV